MQNEPASRQITILSLDYDGCCDMLFKQAIEDGCYKDELDPMDKKYSPNYKTVIQETRTALERYLMKETQHADRVELLVGSTRQTRRLDKFNNAANNNGLCFELYADLAEKKGWYFNRLLLADVENEYGFSRKVPLKWGTTMGTLNKNESGHYKYKKDILADSLTTYSDPYKKRIITHQIQAIADQYPHDQIKFIFIDDRQDILDALKKYFMDEKQLYSTANIEIKLMRFDITNLFSKYACKPANATLRAKEAEQQIRCHSHYNLNMQQYITSSNALTRFNIFYPPVKQVNAIAPDYIYNLLRMGLGGFTIFVLAYFLTGTRNEKISQPQRTP